MVAKNDKAQASLMAQLKARGVKKTYLGLVQGAVAATSGRIEAPIGRDPHHRTRMAVVPDGRPAVTGYRVRERLPGWTLLELDLVTGRTHQIRVHLDAIGHPLAGDPLYGTGTSRRGPEGLARLFLHSWRIELQSPADGHLIRADGAAAAASSSRCWRGCGPRRPAIACGRRLRRCPRARRASVARSTEPTRSKGSARARRPRTRRGPGAPNPMLVIISGPSGVGKDTIIAALQKRGHRTRTTTTSSPARRARRRPDEIHGVSYHFMTSRRVHGVARRGRAARGERGPRQLVRHARGRRPAGARDGAARDPQDRRPGRAGRQGLRPGGAPDLRRAAVDRDARRAPQGPPHRNRRAAGAPAAERGDRARPPGRLRLRRGNEEGRVDVTAERIERDHHRGGAASDPAAWFRSEARGRPDGQTRPRNFLDRPLAMARNPGRRDVGRRPDTASRLPSTRRVPRGPTLRGARPGSLRSKPGEAVLVEFGRGRQALGVVLGAGFAGAARETLKPILARVRADGPLLPPLSLEFARWISASTSRPRRRAALDAAAGDAGAARPGRGVAAALGWDGGAAPAAAMRIPRNRELARRAGRRTAGRCADLRAREGGRPTLRRLRSMAARGLRRAGVDAHGGHRRPAIRALAHAHRRGQGSGGGNRVRGRAESERAVGWAPRQKALLEELAASRRDRHLRLRPPAERHGSGTATGLIRRGLVAVGDPRAAPPAAGASASGTPGHSAGGLRAHDPAASRGLDTILSSVRGPRRDAAAARRSHRRREDGRLRGGDRRHHLVRPVRPRPRARDRPGDAAGGPAPRRARGGDRDPAFRARGGRAGRRMAPHPGRRSRRRRRDADGIDRPACRYRA